MDEDVTRVILAHEPSASALNHRTSKVERGTATQAAAGNGAPELILLKRFYPGAWPAGAPGRKLYAGKHLNLFCLVWGIARLCDFASQHSLGDKRILEHLIYLGLPLVKPDIRFWLLIYCKEVQLSGSCYR